MTNVLMKTGIEVTVLNTLTLIVLDSITLIDKSEEPKARNRPSVLH